MLVRILEWVVCFHCTVSSLSALVTYSPVCIVFHLPLHLTKKKSRDIPLSKDVYRTHNECSAFILNV